MLEARENRFSQLLTKEIRKRKGLQDECDKQQNDAEPNRLTHLPKALVLTFQMNLVTSSLVIMT